MLHWVRTLIRAMHVAPTDRVLSASSPSSLGGFTSLLTFPLAGAASEMFEIKEAGLGGLVEALAQRPVTILRAAPSLLRALAQHPEMATPAMAGLRIVQTYGEPLLKQDVAAIRQLLPPGCRIRTTYGSTEASGLSWFAGDPDEHDPIRVATGALMPDTEARIVDEGGRDCLSGEEGELIIASRYNALGEWREGRLVPGALEPHPDDPGARVFRTGDLARCSADGVFVVVGRKDRMAKINGQRVEPAEVETALRALPGVDRAEVVVDQSTGRTRLVAFVVSVSDAGEEFAETLRRALAARLPAFMVPSRILLVEAIPLLAGGKVDGAALLDRLKADER
jgi:acyl-coenzyme A synthetase/AMP-(fatty) acid ligase